MQAPQEPAQDQMALLDKPSWEQVEALLKDNAHRNFRIDIETDSTIASSLDADMAGLTEVLGGIAKFIEGAEPLVQSGMLPIEAAKEIVMTITRRARMGMAVEDALDKMRAPAPATDPNADKAQAEQAKIQAQSQSDQMNMKMQAQIDAQAEAGRQQFEQQKLAMEAQARQHQADLDAQVENNKQQAQAMQNAHQNQLEAEREQQRAHNEAVLGQMKIASDDAREESRQQFALLIAELNNANKIEVAEVTAGNELDLAQMQAANEASENAKDRAIAAAAPEPAAPAGAN
jgi:hypothetical protein